MSLSLMQASIKQLYRISSGFASGLALICSSKLNAQSRSFLSRPLLPVRLIPLIKVEKVKLSGVIPLSCISMKRFHALSILPHRTQASMMELYVTSLALSSHRDIDSNISNALSSYLLSAHPLIIVLNVTSSGVTLDSGLLILAKISSAHLSCRHLMHESMSTLNKISSKVKFSFVSRSLISFIALSK